MAEEKIIELQAVAVIDDVIRVDRADDIARVSIDRELQNNSINNDVRTALITAFDLIEEDHGYNAVILTGAGDEAFSIGSDVGQMSAMAPMEIQELALRAKQMHQRIVECRLPVIAAIHGACTGAGLELALHCDIRFARDDARFGFPGINIGLTSGGGALYRLGKIIGAGPARALALTGGVISAERAFMLGLITNVLKQEDYEEGVWQFAQHMAALPSDTMTRVKGLLNAIESGDEDAANELGIEAMTDCFSEGETGDRLRQMYGGSDPDITVH